jgi:hypothetical protein
MRIPKKGLVLKNGNRLSQGQLFIRETTMANDNGQRAAMQRAMTPGAKPNTAPKGLARAEHDKVLPTPAISPGMHRVTTGELHPYLHGQAFDDGWQYHEALDGNVPTAFGQGRPDRNDGDKLRDKHDPKLGNVVLDEAGRLGRKA